MSRGGFGRGGGGGRGRGFGDRGGGRGGGRGGFQQRDFGPPDHVLEFGTFMHSVEDEMLCNTTMAEKVPKFNAPIYLENKSQIGKVDEILGPINEVYFTVKTAPGMLASSFKKGDKVYIAGDMTLPLDRFLPKPKIIDGQVKKRGRGGARGAPRGGRGAPRGRGGPRGGGRGGFGGGFGGDRGRGGSGFRGRGGPPRGRGFAPRGRGY
ncbi:H/ACA snoRNP pseudouridylase subunit [Tulasnella sp. JGI-2019a]|nr:H/ACA snoRNP pseudouridylase subunit [Tulasnella sp. JGI-2019a]KAG8997256.1 H/ACA snoRNP pseudouridylase subunit [Tulasnella sp. JGI-2019a]KAG9028190.1 H/ACA snoRNP pseudouridylase subunit [Tulasnella sp. JGI-2019a]